MFQPNSHERHELFYDCLSPFSYLAFTVLERYQPVWEVDLRLRPLLLGGVPPRLYTRSLTAYSTVLPMPALHLLVPLPMCHRCTCSCNCCSSVSGWSSPLY